MDNRHLAGMAQDGHGIEAFQLLLGESLVTPTLKVFAQIRLFVQRVGVELPFEPGLIGFLTDLFAFIPNVGKLISDQQLRLGFAEWVFLYAQVNHCAAHGAVCAFGDGDVIRFFLCD